MEWNNNFFFYVKIMSVYKAIYCLRFHFLYAVHLYRAELEFVFIFQIVFKKL